MHITRIQLRNWKNFQEVDVQIRPRLFLVGPNASGKSNFLDALRFLRDIARSDDGGGLRAACEARGGLSKIRCLSARRTSNVGVSVEMRIGEDEWSYELEFGQEAGGKRLPVVVKEVALCNDDIRSRRPDEYDQKDPARLSQTSLEQVSANAAFRDAASALETIFYLHLVPQVVRGSRDMIVQSKRFNAYGHELLERMAAAHAQTRKARLKRIEEALQTAVPQLKQLELIHDSRGVPHLQAKYEHWRKHPAGQSEEQFSDGTLRLIGILWALMDGEGPLLMEEPELSLHEGLIQNLVQLFYRASNSKRGKEQRQTLISTHSATLLMDEGIAANEVAVFQPGKEGTRVVLTNKIPHIDALMNANITAGETAIPFTHSKDAHQLVFALD